MYENLRLHFPQLCVIGFPPPVGAGPAGAGRPGQGTRFLHTSRSFHRFSYPTRSVHDTVIARLTPEDIKKAREVKQAQVKPVRQKVGGRATSEDERPLHTWDATKMN